jgi:transposase
MSRWLMRTKATGEKWLKKLQPGAASNLEVVKHTEAKRGFVLLPRRWVVERSFARAARFRHLARDYERLATTLGAFHFLALACLMIGELLGSSHEVNNRL